jgi:hypothetical protein
MVEHGTAHTHVLAGRREGPLVKIGDWVRRRGGKWHKVESVVAGDAVTRCGRRMHEVSAYSGRLQVSDVEPLTRMIGQPQLCRRCG